MKRYDSLNRDITKIQFVEQRQESKLLEYDSGSRLDCHDQEMILTITSPLFIL